MKEILYLKPDTNKVDNVLEVLGQLFMRNLMEWVRDFGSRVVSFSKLFVELV